MFYVACLRQAKREQPTYLLQYFAQLTSCDTSEAADKKKLEENRAA